MNRSESASSFTCRSNSLLLLILSIGSLIYSTGLESQILVSEPGELNFGTIESAASLRSFVVLRNTSAKPVFLLRAESPKNFDVYSSSKKIAPGDTLHLRFMYIPPQAGKVDEVIRLIHSGGSDPLNIRVNGQILNLTGSGMTNCVNFDPKSGSGQAGAIIPTITSHEVLISDLETGKAVPNASITYTSLRSGERITRLLKSGSPGLALPVDLYELRIAAPGYLPQKREVYLGASGLRSVYTLEPELKTPVASNFPAPQAFPPISRNPEPNPEPAAAVELDENLYKPNNLIFLVDISGSMRDPQKLPLLKESVFTLLEPIRPIDKISVIAYSSNAELVVPPTAGNRKEEIYTKLDTMQAGGTTAGSEGIRKAYELATASYIVDGNNRILLATDGAFRVSGKERELIENAAASERPIYLTILAFDSESDDLGMLAALAKLGKGEAISIRKGRQAERILLEEIKKQSRR